MEFSYIAPGPALRGVIRDYLIAHFVFDPEQPAPIKPYAPKPEQGITFFLKGRPSVAHPLTGRTHKAPRVAIFGQQVCRCDVRLESEFLMLRVHFQPGALYRMIGVPLHEFGEGYVDAEPLLRDDVRAVSDRLCEARSRADLITAVESYLARRLAGMSAAGHPADRVARWLSAQSHPPLDWLARQAGLSRRQLARTFSERVGVAPKLYSRLARFHHACLYKAAHPSVAWTDVALELGYTDYQHMVRDCRAFTNATPTAWFREDRASPERVLALHG